MRDLAVRRSAFERGRFEALRDALLDSPLVGRSTLAGPFQASRGFAVIFREGGRARLLERFPALGPYLDQVLGRPAVRALTPWLHRVTRVPNAWYLNVLLVSAGGRVGLHVDATLARVVERPTAVPELVSVLYLTVPEAEGGQLKIYSGDSTVAVVEPEEDMVVHFRGDLAHEVCPFEGAAGALRASLVIEQYHLGEAELSKVPDFRVDSRGGFRAYLDAHAQKGEPRAFELEP